MRRQTTITTRKPTEAFIIAFEDKKLDETKKEETASTTTTRTGDAPDVTVSESTAKLSLAGLLPSRKVKSSTVGLLFVALSGRARALTPAPGPW